MRDSIDNSGAAQPRAATSAPPPGPANRAAIDSLQRRVAFRAVLLLAIAMFTGGWAGIALSGKVVIPIPHLALAAHLNALLGSFWLLAFAFTLPMLSYSDQAKERLAWLQLVPNYANWLVTLIASFLGVRGIEFTGNTANDVIAAALLAFVVGPALVGTVAWAWGFRGGGGNIEGS